MSLEGNPGGILKCWIFNGRKFCVPWQQWPTVVFDAYPVHPGPDPGPNEFRIEGVRPELVREVMVLAIIQQLSKSLAPDAGSAIRGAVADREKGIKQQLPEGVTFV